MSFIQKLFSSVDNWIKRNAPEIPEQYAKEILALDPTYKGDGAETVGKYGAWLMGVLKNRIKEIIQIDPDMKDTAKVFAIQEYLSDKDYHSVNKQKMRNALLVYHTLASKNKLPPDYKDIFRFKLPIQLRLWAEQKDIRELYKEIAEQDVQKDIILLYEDENWYIASPKTHRASVKLGRGFRKDGTTFSWCTSADSDQGAERFGNYTRQGDSPKVIWLSKKDPQEGYASIVAPNQFRDKGNSQNLSPAEWASIFPREALVKVAEFDPKFRDWIGEYLYSDDDPAFQAILFERLKFVEEEGRPGMFEGQRNKYYFEDADFIRALSFPNVKHIFVHGLDLTNTTASNFKLYKHKLSLYRSAEIHVQGVTNSAFWGSIQDFIDSQNTVLGILSFEDCSVSLFMEFHVDHLEIARSTVTGRAQTIGSISMRDSILKNFILDSLEEDFIFNGSVVKWPSIEFRKINPEAIYRADRTEGNLKEYYKMKKGLTE